jgi:hypothetical protein
MRACISDNMCGDTFLTPICPALQFHGICTLNLCVKFAIIKFSAGLACEPLHCITACLLKCLGIREAPLVSRPVLQDGLGIEVLLQLQQVKSCVQAVNAAANTTPQTGPCLSCVMCMLQQAKSGKMA